MHADDVYIFVLFVTAIDDDDWRLDNRAFSDDDADSKNVHVRTDDDLYLHQCTVDVLVSDSRLCYAMPSR